MNQPILLISDDAGTNLGLRRALMTTALTWPMETTATRSGVEAVSSPAFILLDLKLSGSPPFEILRWLRREKLYKDIPVFVLGSKAANRQNYERVVNQAYALGANACLLEESCGEGFAALARGLIAYASVLSHSRLHSVTSRRS